MWSACVVTRKHAGIAISACGLLFVLSYLVYFSQPFTSPLLDPQTYLDAHRNVSTQRIPCRGPRGLLNVNRDEVVQSKAFGNSDQFPTPIGGSFETLRLTTELNTPTTRYSAYGYGEELDDYDRSRVDWSTVDWAELQNECLTANEKRFRNAQNISALSRTFELHQVYQFLSNDLVARKTHSHRTAIVVRAWEGYKWTPGDHHHLRALIVEAGLASNADYAVFLLVDVKDRDGTRRIFHDPESYERALREIVHPEYQSIAVLFDAEMLQSWYPKVPEHSVFWQVYQPLQLFAQFFPDFDHYWQLEMDIRFTGDARLLLDAMSDFAREEPRKQSVERASYYYMPEVHGPFDHFVSSINSSLEGRGIWGPISISDIPNPIGHVPPVKDPIEDNFRWGVGEDADLIVTNAIANVSAAKYWPFKDWVHNFAEGQDTPRFYSNVAMGRYSWNLLNAMHHAQADQGLTLPSEASAVSFALYHGLKISFPPLPWWHHPQVERKVEAAELESLYNGGTPAENAVSNNGFSYGQALYNPDGVYELFNGKTWWWVPGEPGRVFKHWLQQDAENLPSALMEADGQIWAPNTALHPVKKNDLD